VILKSAPFQEEAHQPFYNFIQVLKFKFIILGFIFEYLRFKGFLQDYIDHYTHYHEVNHANLHSSALPQYFDSKSFILIAAVSHSESLFVNHDFLLQ
jgi:uncharacterized protein YutD